MCLFLLRFVQYSASRRDYRWLTSPTVGISQNLSGNGEMLIAWRYYDIFLKNYGRAYSECHGIKGLLLQLIQNIRINIISVINTHVNNWHFDHKALIWSKQCNVILLPCTCKVMQDNTNFLQDESTDRWAYWWGRDDVTQFGCHIIPWGHCTANYT